MMKSLNISKDMFIYGLGGLLVKSIAIFLLPIYTNYFTPSEFSRLEILIVITNLIGGLMMLGMDSAQSMYFFKYKKKGKLIQGEIVSSILQFRLTWSLIIIGISTLISPLLNSIFFFNNLTIHHFLIAFISTLFMQIMGQSSEVMRLLFRPWKYIQIIFIQSWLSVIFIAVSLLFFDKGILGVFLGILFSSIIASLFGWYQIKEYINFKKIHFYWWSKIISFGAPMVLPGVAIYLINTIDRWFLLKYEGDEILGIFAAGAKISYLITLGVEVFRKAFWPYALDNMFSYNGKKFFRTTARIYFAFATSVVALITFLSPLISQFFLGEEFREGWKIVGVLAWHGVGFGALMIFSAGIWKVEKTYLLSYLMIFGLLISIILNFLLVPPLGMMGAALGTAIANMTLAFSAMYLSQKYWKIPYDFKKFIYQILVTSIFVYFYLHFYLSMNLLVLILILFSTIIIIFSSLSKSDKKNIYKYLNNFKYKKNKF